LRLYYDRRAIIASASSRRAPGWRGFAPARSAAAGVSGEPARSGDTIKARVDPREAFATADDQQRRCRAAVAAVVGSSKTRPWCSPAERHRRKLQFSGVMSARYT
jgi:hypothetical protein